MSSDAGLLLLHKFIDKLDLHSLLKNCFKTTDKANRQHLDHEILLQKIYQICAGYFTDDVSDELSIDPTLTTCLEKKRLASQPTISRFGSRLDEITLGQFHRHGYDIASSSGLIGMEMQGAMAIFTVNLKRIIKLIG